MRALFEWLDVHPGSYWLTAAAATIGLLGWMIAEARAATPARWRAAIFPALLFLFLLAWRWPYLFAANEYNPDESQLIAGAMTLWHDPVPWRSLDVATSGPLNYYALWPLHLAGLPFDYFAARLAALGLVWGALLACHHLFARLGRKGPAFVATLFPATFFAGAGDEDFVHYSSEHVSLFLMAVAAAALLAPVTGRDSRRSWLLGGLAAGLLPWAKLQAAPLAAMLAAAGVLHLFLAAELGAPARRRGAGALALGLALPSAVALAVLTATGQLQSFWQSYLRANVSYITDAPSTGALVRRFAEEAGQRGHYIAYVVAAGGCLLALMLFCALRRRRPVALYWVGAAGFAAALVCVLVPQRPLLHYLLFSIIPLAWWCGGALLSANLRGSATAVLALVALLPLGWTSLQEDPEEFGRFALDWRQPRSLVGGLLRRHAAPGDRLAVWGWQTSLHVDSGLPQGTHDGNTAWSMPLAPASQRDFYQQRYLHDLAANRPRFFVDAVGPGAMFFTNRTTHGHEAIPALGQLIAAEYVLWLDDGVARIYVRRDQPLPPAPAAAELAQLRNSARRGPGILTSPPDETRPAGVQDRSVRGRFARMVLPETRLEWQLEGQERVVWLDYGMHPEAWGPDRSTGAELLVELQARDGDSQVLLQRVIDPRRWRDRLPLTSRLPLPPFPAGSRLVVRTTAGPDNSAAWDWVYLQRVRFQRSAAYVGDQFPGFSRPPDQASAAHAALIDGPADRYLSLQAPARLRFPLDGGERRLEFDFGFDAGAYTGEGHTDGATYVVTLERRQGPAQTLYQRKLNPAAEPADRGRQHAQVALGETAPGDLLLLSIEPGPSTSWDWTYVAALKLE